VEDNLPCFIHGWLPRSNLEATPATPLTVLSLCDHSSDGLDVASQSIGVQLDPIMPPISDSDYVPEFGFGTHGRLLELLCLWHASKLA
jgi:hypothetical protein